MMIDAPLRVTHSLCLAASAVGPNTATDAHSLPLPPLRECDESWRTNAAVTGPALSSRSVVTTYRPPPSPRAPGAGPPGRDAPRSPVASWRPARRGGTCRAGGRSPPAPPGPPALSWRLWRRIRSRYELPCTHAQDRAELLAALDASSDGLQLGFEVLGFGAVAGVCGLNLRGEAAVLAGHHEGLLEAALVALDCEVQAGPLGVELARALLYGT